MLNRSFSLWQYALLLLMLVTFAFYSLPTFFGEQPSLGLHGERRPVAPGATRSAPCWPRTTGRIVSPSRQIAQGGRMALVFASQGAATGQASLLEQQGWTAPP